MPKLALYNIAWGFSWICIAAAAGAFVSTSLTEQYLNEVASKNWLLTLKTSAHGHTNMLAMVQILFGITMPYSKLSMHLKRLQTWGISLGVAAMAFGLLSIGFRGPTRDIHLFEVVTGVLLACMLLSLIAHVYGILLRAQR